MIGKNTPAYSQILQCSKFLQEGVVVCLDPSSGSRSSMPGYAVYVGGDLLVSGILELDVSQPLHIRLRKLNYLVRKLYSTYDPDVLVFEDVPAVRYGGNATFHASLLKSVGTILGISGPRFTVGLAPSSWTVMARSGYVKSDENDSIEIGYVAIEESKRIEAIEGRRKTKRKKT